MADVASAVRTRLTAHAGTLALISSRAWFNALPENPTYPACVVTKVDSVPVPLMGADATDEPARVQVDCWGTTRASAQALRIQVRSALKRWGGTSDGTVVTQAFLINELELFDDEVTAFRFSLDFRVWYTEN